MTTRTAAEVADLLEVIFYAADEFHAHKIKRTTVRSLHDTVIASLPDGQTFTFTVGQVLDAQITDEHVVPDVPMPPPPKRKRAPRKAPAKKAAPRKRPAATAAA